MKKALNRAARVMVTCCNARELELLRAIRGMTDEKKRRAHDVAFSIQQDNLRVIGAEGAQIRYIMDVPTAAPPRLRLVSNA